MTAFLKRHTTAIVSFVLLLLSIHLALTDDEKGLQRAQPLEGVLQKALLPVQEGLLSAHGVVRGVFDDYLFVLGVKRENEALKEELISLREEVTRLREEVKRNERLKGILDYREGLPLKTVPASVVSFSADRWTKTVLLDRGEADGIRKDMPVIHPRGFVGRVIETEMRTSRVLLVTDLRSNVDAIVQRTRLMGVVEGSGKDALTLKYVRLLDDVQVGDLVLTSGVSGLIPKGVAIGEVTGIEKGREGFFHQIEVSPSVDFSRLEEVLVVKDFGLPGSR